MLQIICVTQWLNDSSNIKQQMKLINIAVEVTSMNGLEETAARRSAGVSCPSITVMLTLFLPAAFPTQAFKPSPHVCSNLVSPARPHLPCQDPLLPQQLAPALLEPQIHSENQITFIFCIGRKYKRFFWHDGEPIQPYKFIWISLSHSWWLTHSLTHSLTPQAGLLGVPNTYCPK